MLWFIATCLAYFFYSLSSLGDKIILAGPAKPKEYTFTVGMSSILAVLIIPFASLLGFEFGMPQGIQWLWIGLDAIVYILGLYCMFSALDRFEVSRVMPTIGATQPIFIFILTCCFWGMQVFRINEIIAFALLLIGSLVISVEKGFKLNKDSLWISFITSILFSLDYVFSKMVFLDLGFWNGFIWIRMASFLLVVLLLLNKDFRQGCFDNKRGGVGRENITVFAFTQAAGGTATVLQSWAISLAPVAYLAIINSMRGVQYVFLFIMTAFITYFIPKVLKEEISQKIIWQKIIAILIISAGLVVFSI
jgi:drug/metabolite transporter (DMT)-like permease